MYINQGLFTGTFPQQKSVLDAEQNNEATTVGMKDKTIQSLAWLAHVFRLKDEMILADFQEKWSWEPSSDTQLSCERLQGRATWTGGSSTTGLPGSLSILCWSFIMVGHRGMRFVKAPRCTEGKGGDV